MKVFRLYRQQALTMDIESAWRFFTSPHHLNTITPDFFTITPTSPVPDEIYSGLMISYDMRAVFGIPMTWLSEISHCQRPHYFVYNQGIGPFKLWSHEVRLTRQPQGILLEDIVFYAMPWGWLGRLFHRIIIRAKLESIFSTRQNYLTQNWGSFDS